MKKIIEMRIFFSIWTLVMMAVILSFSFQSAGESSQVSGGILEAIFRLLPVSVSPEQMDFCHFLLRKTAHFTLYLMLGVGVMGLMLTTKCCLSHAFLWAVLFCALFASGDEFQQYLSGTRSGEIRDVLLDSCGAFSGCVLCWGVRRFWQNRKP